MSQSEHSAWQPPQADAPPPAEAPPSGVPARSSGDNGDSAQPDSIAIAPIIWTTAICGVLAIGGHVVLWVGSSLGWAIPTEGGRGASVPWQPVTGIVLVGVAIVAFGGYYIAARRARVAISASFLLTFLVALSYVLTLQGLAEATQGGAKDLFGDFRTVVIVIIGFYFGTEALVAGAKIIGTALGRGDAAQVQRADRDLAPRPRG